MKKLIIFMIIIFFFITVYSTENDNLTNETSIITNITEFDLINETSVNITSMTEFNLNENVFNETEEIISSEIEEKKVDSEIIKEVTIPKNLLTRSQQFPNEIQRVIIIFSKKPENYKQFIPSLEGEIIHDYDIIEGIAVSLPGRVIERLRELKNVISIQEDREVHAFLTESVPLINADDVWALGYDGSGKTVCVVDTGINYNHPALLGKVIAQHCYCSIDPPGRATGCCPDGTIEDDNAMDDEGHGTHCAGIIASSDVTYKGVAYGANLMAVKVLDSTGSGYESDVIKGIDWCSAQNADIISISLGGGLFSSYCDSEADAQAVNNAVNAGAVVSIASGNDASTTGISAPACASKAISVGAVYDANVGSKSWGKPTLCADPTTYPDKIVCFTNRNDILDILAPGSVITSTKLGGGFTDMSGTSMAAPHVSGATALLLEAKPGLTPAQVEGIFKNTGVNIYDGGSGLTFPRIDVLAAVNFPTIGHLKSYLIDPLTNKNVTQNQFFNFSSEVNCVGGECGDVRATLKLYFESHPTTCSEIWGFDCGTGPPETGGDNTFDSCSNGAGGDEGINEIYLDKNKVGFGEEIEVKCNVVIKSLSCGVGYTGDKLYIYYRNSPTGTWQKKHYVSQVYSCRNYSIKFIPDNVKGEQQVRCIVGYNIVEGECASGSYYDNDDANFTVVKDIIPTVEDIPFYTTSDNPQTCYDMQDQGSCNQTWQINATGNINTTWQFFTIYDSITYNWYIKSNKTEKVNITIVEAAPEEFISITLFGYPIDFANLDPETNNNSALGNSGNQYKIRVDTETTINVDLYQKGNDFSGPSILGISNMSWYNISDVGLAIPMNGSYGKAIATNIIPNTNISSYYWLTIPPGQKAGNYLSTIYIKAVKTGTSP